MSKFLLLVLCNVLLVAGGIFLYDAFKQEEPSPGLPSDLQLADAMRKLEEVEGDDGSPRFDEGTLKTLEAYVDEINRRKARNRRHDRLASELDRLELELPEAARTAIIEASLMFQDKARELLRKNWARDEEGRAARRAAFMTLQEEYKTAIGSLIPAVAAEKVMTSRIARGMGFTSRSGDR